VTVDAWTALADPTRRDILARVARAPLSVTEIAEGITTTRPNVSQHLRVLRDAGLVRADAVGTKRIYSARPDGLAALRAELDRFWGEALANFKERAESSRDTNERKAR
jgi:DNA-binding transcriptional ArsR family regulator